jgi:hypothetical protein
MAGNTYTISLTDGFFYFGDEWGVWIDLNHNGIFEDVGEFTHITALGAVTTGNINIPSNAFNGPTRMRVRLQFVGTPSSCGNTSWGEVEDYTVNITGGQALPPFMSFSWATSTAATLSANNTQTVTASNFTASETFTATATRRDGCFETATTQVSLSCSNTLTLKLYLQGYYNGGGFMVPAAFNQGHTTNSSLTDSITVELRDANPPYAVTESLPFELMTNGTASGTFTSTGSKYIVINHRNSIQTWSAAPVTLIPNTLFDFSVNAAQAYGGNMIDMGSGVYAMYTGDLNIDENIDLLDLGLLEQSISNFDFGYFSTDLNGDANVDLLDAPIMEINVNSFIFSSHP